MGLPPKAPTVIVSTPSRQRRWLSRWILAAFLLFALVTLVTPIGRAAFLFVRNKPAPPTLSVSPGERTPETFVYALLLSEDSKFFAHRGFDTRQIQRSIQLNLERERFALGGSTIPMQLAKLLYLSPQKTLERKTTQTLLAIFLEHAFSKSEILKLYIDRLDFGLEVPGLWEASRHYFHKPPADLTIEECLKLVYTIRNPKLYNPTMTVSPDALLILTGLNRRLERDWFLFRNGVQGLPWIKTELYYH